MTIKTTYKWQEIINVPQKSGVYAWYFSPEITEFDLSEAIQKLKAYQGSQDRESSLKLLDSFLFKNIFSYFEEDPYEAILSGPLKPKYQGKLSYQPNLSSSLIERILEDPERLRTIKNVLEKSAPFFSSPLYIGMAERLGSRLLQHKKLIEKYRSQMPIQDKTLSHEGDYGDVDNSFAFEIYRRQITPSRLFVAINIIDDKKQNYVDIENILNRIHYPLLGRN